MPWYEVRIKSSEVFEAEDQDEANEYCLQVTTLEAVECADPNEAPAPVKKAKKKAKVKAKSTYRRKKKARLR